MSRNASLKAITRDVFGKGEMHRLRATGRVPAIIYGPGEETVPVSVDEHELSILLQRVSFENTIIDLAVSGKVEKKYQTLIREVQRHPYRSQFHHLDFYSVPMDREIVVEVPIILHGNPLGVRNEGGLIQHVLRDLEILVLPNKIPEHLVIDISELHLHESIHVEDLAGGDYKILTDSRRTVVTIVSKQVATLPEPGEEVTEAVVIGEGEEGAEEGAEEAADREKESEE
ncbi:MAG TPA: 50S ribosomal protein L25 [Candidatus Glassbacteria bacterium]|nr:50S ribosomal protein L25 [Candidatus Glassbacteria bacterium]